MILPILISTRQPCVKLVMLFAGINAVAPMQLVGFNPRWKWLWLKSGNRPTAGLPIYTELDIVFFAAFHSP